MELYSENENYKLYKGNMLDMLEVIEPNTIDAVITDPPYELNFMNKGWDNSGIAFQKETWQKCYEVLKSGGYLLAFGGSRTFHRIACAIEDAGFEIRDTIMWLYGSGFPKSMALDKSLEAKLKYGNANKTEFHKLSGIQENKHHYGFTTANKEQGIRPKDYTIEGASNQYLKELEATTDLAKKFKGWGTALKPSYEPIIVARKPFKGSLVDNVIEYGVGGINIDECRVKSNGEKLTRDLYDNPSWKNCSKAGQGSVNDVADILGRFPANTILTYDETDFDEVCGAMPYTKSGGGDKSTKCGNTFLGTGYGGTNTTKYEANEGSASRYFYCAKASKRDRDEGLDGFNETTVNDGRQTPIDNAFQRGETQRKNSHPCVKPCDLMQYLVRLVTPNGGIILDPFNGSGSTGKAVMYENKERNKNYKYIGIELTEEYLPISKARIDHLIDIPKEEPKEDIPTGQTNIFDFIESE